MVVHQDDGGGGKFQSPLDDLARIDRRVVDGAAALHFIGDEDILAVEEEDAKFLALLARHRGRAVIQQRRPGRQRRPPDHPRFRQPVGGGFHDLQLRRHVFANALHFQQSFAWRRDHFGEAAEAGQERLGQRLGVPPGQGGEQGHFQQFVIGHGVGATLEEARPQSFAVAGMRGFRWGKQSPRIFNASNAF
jgi:hypothetical protein